MSLKKQFTVIVLLFAGSLISFAQLKRSPTNQPTNPKRTLTIYAMSNYFPEKILKEFERRENCKVRYDNFSNNEELLAKLQAGVSGYDVIVPSDYAIRNLIAGKLLLDINKVSIPNIKNISPDFLNPPYDPDNKYSIPYSWGTTGLIYNYTKTKEEITSWNSLFKKEYERKISLLDDQREVMGALLRKLGYSTNTRKPDELKQAKKLLIELKPHVRLFSSDPKQHLLSGDIWIAHIYSGDAQQVIRTNPDFRYVTPKEGGVVWADTLAIPKGAKNIELAHAFINFLAEPAVAKMIAEELLYATANAAAEKQISKDFLKPNFIKKLPQGLEYLQDLGSAASIWNQMWIEAKSY